MFARHMKSDFYLVVFLTFVALAAILVAVCLWGAFRERGNLAIVALLGFAEGCVVLFASMQLAYSSYTTFGTPRYWWFLTPAILTLYGIILCYVLKHRPPSASVVLCCGVSVLAIFFVGPYVLGIASCVTGGECL